MSRSPTPARDRALDRLQRIEGEGAFSGLVAPIGRAEDDAREERQASEYVAGVTRLRRWLDYLIDEFYSGPPEGLEAVVRQVLRMALYDLLVLETPAHAVVNESVELVKRAGRRRAAGLVNGLLRSVVRARGGLPEPHTGDPVRDLGLAHSHPDWIVARWLERFGLEVTEALLESSNARPVYHLRVNTLRHTRESFTQELDRLGVEWESSPHVAEFVRVGQLQAVLRAGLVTSGDCAVQDEAAALVVNVLEPQKGDTVIDCAAAPGGKALLAALRMGDEGRVIAVDVHEGRLDLVREAARIHGIQSIELVAGDLVDLVDQGQLPTADRVLLDAPCSGLGVLAKRADLRWRRTPEEIPELCALQDRLLDAAARLVRPGGILVYGTCTIEPEENEERVETFLESHTEFRLDSARGLVPDDMITRSGFYLALPHLHGTDGAFAARLRREH